MILSKLSAWFSNLTRTNRFLLNLVLIFFIAWLDWITPHEFNMRLFYLIPISLSVWYEKEIKTGIFFSILSTSLTYYTDMSQNSFNLHGFYLIWELLMLCGFYIIFVVIVHKINKARVTLQQSEKKFRNLFDNSEVGMFRTRLDGSEILDFNEKYLRILNYTRDEIKGKPSANIWADKSERDMMVKTLIAEGHVTDLEFDLLNKQGEVRRCITSLQLYRDTGILEGSILDITDRKRGEETQLKITERLSLACRAGGIGIWELDIVNNNLIWDDQMFNLYGITPDKFSGTYEAWRAGVHPEDLQKSEKELQMSIRGEKDFDTEFRIVWPDGTIHTIRALAFLQRDASGQPINLIGTNYDITKFKLAEEELQQSNQKWKAIILASPDGIGMMSLDGKMQLMSDKLAKMFGYSIGEKDEFIGKSSLDFIDPSSHKMMLENIRKLLAGEIDNKITEYLAIKKDNSRFYVELHSTVLFDSNGNPTSILFVERDITARKQAEVIIQQQNNQLQELNACP